jgi:hypothetical protein
MNHKHKVKSVEVYPWTTCVRGENGGRPCPNPAAHGNVVLVQRCACGAVRLVEANYEHRVMGRWETGQEVPNG